MSLLGYAKLRSSVSDLKSGEIIYILNRDGDTTKFIHRRSRNIYVVDLSLDSILMFPHSSEILKKLSDFTRVGILWQLHEGQGWYSVVNMEFGLQIRDTVPVYSEGVKKGEREIVSTRHLKIRARSFDQAVYALFFAALSGKLCRKRLNNEFEFLAWDTEKQKFKTSIKNSD